MTKQAKKGQEARDAAPQQANEDESVNEITKQAACILKEYQKGTRAKAKKSLQKLSKDNPQSYVPHRYLARLLYHEAAVLEAQQYGGRPSEPRLQILREALESARIATELNPCSLSSAALRATLVVNVLVEESSLFGGPGISSAEAIKQEFRDAIAACIKAANAPNPQMAEPVININDGGSQTCDPCSLRVQDQILQWVREGRWDKVVQEKRNVLVCMQQVLQSCHTLLDSTQIPVDGVVRLLQHILRSLLPHRPMQQDLQTWASQLLGKGMSLDDFQKKFETQSAVTELLKMLRPQAGLMGGQGGPLPDALLLQHAQQALLQQSTLQPQPVAAQAVAQQAGPSGSGQQPSQPVAAPAVLLPPAQQQPMSMPLPVPAQPPQQQHQQLQQQHPLPPLPQQNTQLQSRQASVPVQAPVHPSPAAALSEERDWEWDKEVAATGANPQGAPAAGSAVAAASRRRAKSKAAGKLAVGGQRCKERSRYERYTDVEAFWKSLQPEQRRELLRVPLASLLQSVRQEHGQEAVEEACEGLVLLHEQHNRSARYWCCPTCDQKFHSGREFLAHVELAHEEVAVQGGKYVVCCKCQVEVVGMYYTSTCVADYNLCARCFHQELASVPDVVTAYERIYPRVPSVGGPRRWSESGSDFVSTRDSFTSLEEMEEMAAPTTPQRLGVGVEASSEWASPLDQLGTPLEQHSQHGPHPHSNLRQVAGEMQGSDSWNNKQRRGSGSSGHSVPAAMPPPPPATCPPLLSAPAPPAPAPPSSVTVSELTAHEQGDDGSGQQPPARQGSGDTQGSTEGGGLLKSWWPRRLLQSWGADKKRSKEQAATEQELGGQPGGAPQSQIKAAAGAGGAGGAHAHGMAGGQHNSDHSSEGQSSSWSSGEAVCAGQQQGQVAMQGGAPGGPGGQQGAVVPTHAAVAGQGQYPGEVRELMTIVDEVMQRMREMYSADHHIGDMADTTLGSVMQFVYRKLSVVLDEVAPPEEAPAVRGYLEEFMARPACVFQKPDVLRAVLGCLPFGDLQMVLAYVVRQHSDAMATVASEEGDDEEEVEGSSEDEERQEDRMLLNDALGGAGAAAGSSRAATGSRRPRKQARGDGGGGEDTGMRVRRKRHHHHHDARQGDVDGAGSDACTDDLVLVEPPAPPPLFELHVPDVGALHALVADVWNRDESVEDGVGGGGAAGGAKARAHAGSSAGALAAGELDDLLLLTGLQMEGATSGGGVAPNEADAQPWLSPVSWWVDHLSCISGPPPLPGPPSSKQSAASSLADDGGADTAALKWVYGKIVSRPAEEFQARQRELRAGRERDAAVCDLYEDLAYGWRSLQAALDQRARLEELRKGARAQFALVKQIEEEGRHCNAEEAAEFLEVLMASHYAVVGAAGAAAASAASAEPGAPPPVIEQPRLNMCEAAVDVVRRHPALAGEPSQRYARALLDRELSALLLVEAMLAAEADEAGRARNAAEEALRKHRAEARDVETEHARLEAEGPASHRKKDLLDKATKEAEHRERLQDLQVRLSGLVERISAEEQSRQKWSDRFTEAERDLKSVRDQLRQHSTRRKHLDELCAQLEMPMPPGLVHQQQLAAQQAAAAQQRLPAPPAQPQEQGGAAGAAAPEGGQTATATQGQQASEQAGVAAPQGLQGPVLTVEEWHKQRLEVLMYRLMWVSEAVKNFQDQYSQQSGSRHYELFLKATSWSKSLADEYEQQVRGWYAELDKLRAKLLDVACVDMGYMLTQHSQEVVRRRVEAAARMAREQASLTLLRELEEEEVSSSAVAAAGGVGGKAGAGAAGAAGGAGGKAGKNASKKQKTVDKAREKKEREEAEKQARQAEVEQRRQAEEAERQRLAEARRLREAAIEAELERRRKELEALEAQREAEAIRAAQEASLREAARQKAAAEAAAAAAQAAAAAANNAVGPHTATPTPAGGRKGPAAAAAAVVSSPATPPGPASAEPSPDKPAPANAKRNGKRSPNPNDVVPAPAAGPMHSPVHPGGKLAANSKASGKGQAAVASPVPKGQHGKGAHAHPGEGKRGPTVTVVPASSAAAAAAQAAAAAAVQPAPGHAHAHAHAQAKPPGKHAPKFAVPLSASAMQQPSRAAASASTPATTNTHARMSPGTSPATPSTPPPPPPVPPSQPSSGGGMVPPGAWSNAMATSLPAHMQQQAQAAGAPQAGLVRPGSAPPDAALRVAAPTPTTGSPASVSTDAFSPGRSFPVLAHGGGMQQQGMHDGCVTGGPMTADLSGLRARDIAEAAARNVHELSSMQSLQGLHMPAAHAPMPQRAHGQAGSMFDPFAENPLLRALLPDRGLDSVVPLVPTSMDMGGAAGQQAAAARAAALNSLNASMASGVNTPLMTSPRSDQVQHLMRSPGPGTGTSHELYGESGAGGDRGGAGAGGGDAPPDHIMSIMAILEPEAMAGSGGNSSGNGARGNGGKGSQDVRGRLGQEQLGQRLTAAQQAHTEQGIGTRGRGDGFASAFAGLSAHAMPNILSSTDLRSAGAGGGAASLANASSSPAPLVTSGIPSLMPQANGYSIWSTGAGGSSWGAAPLQSNASMGSHSHMGNDGGSSQAQRRVVMSSLSSAAAPWTGAVGTSSMAGAMYMSGGGTRDSNGAIDFASVLPASLLPATLDMSDIALPQHRSASPANRQAQPNRNLGYGGSGVPSSTTTTSNNANTINNLAYQYPGSSASTATSGQRERNSGGQAPSGAAAAGSGSSSAATAAAAATAMGMRPTAMVVSAAGVVPNMWAGPGSGGIMQGGNPANALAMQLLPKLPGADLLALSQGSGINLGAGGAATGLAGMGGVGGGARFVGALNAGGALFGHDAVLFTDAGAASGVGWAPAGANLGVGGVQLPGAVQAVRSTQQTWAPFTGLAGSQGAQGAVQQGHQQGQQQQQWHRGR